MLITPLFGHICAQNNEKGQFSGNLITQYQKFIRDDKIGANTKVYLEATNSMESWLNLNYRINGYTFTVRYDGFFNSPLLNPIGSYTDHGIGYWQVNKKLKDLDLTVGSFYDQLGSGLLFRSYEQRQIGIDYALQGARAIYNLGNHWVFKGFVGNQKGNINDRFGYAKQVVSGASVESNYQIGQVNMVTGAATLNRALTTNDRDGIVETIKTYDLDKRFVPKGNVYGGTIYSNIMYKTLGVNLEYVQKSKEAILIDNVWQNRNGKIVYASVSWGKRNWKLAGKKANFGMNMQLRHIDHFAIRTAPTEQLLNGLISYMPSLTRQNTYRLLARYNAPAQEIGENGIQSELDLKIGSDTKISINGSYVQSLEENGKNNAPQLLFREIYGELQQKISKKVKLKIGLQSIEYNQAVYEQEVDYENVQTITPFTEVNIKTRHGQNLRLEAQYLSTAQDQGSFFNGIAEYTFNSKLTVAVGDMINTKPHRYSNMNIVNEVLHYPSVFTSYNAGTNVFTLAYLKQQAGVNCSGGICRVEPAFSGVRFTLNSNF